MNKKTSYEMELDAAAEQSTKMIEGPFSMTAEGYFKAGAAFALAYEKKRSAVLVEALEYFKQYDLDSIMRNKIDEALNSYEGGSNE